MATTFRKYEHLERLGHAEVSGLTDGTVYVFPKLDGTNASVWLDAETATIQAGSRNHKLTLEGDNAGFCAWVNQPEQLEKFKRLFAMCPHWRLYGEWLVPHTLKTYRPDAWRRFWIFDVYDAGQQRYVPYQEYVTALARWELDFIPPMAIVERPLVQDLRGLLSGCTFQMQDGAGPGEGIVLKNYSYRKNYGRQTWAKIVRNEFKDAFYVAMGAPQKQGSFDLELTIAQQYVTATLVSKELAKILTDTGLSLTPSTPEERRELGKTVIPRLLGTVWYELIREELWNAIKQHKEPTIDFKRLKRHAMATTKRLSPALFGREVEPSADLSSASGG